MKNQNSVELYKGKPKLVFTPKRSYQLMGKMIFCIACGLTVVRILTWLLSPYIKNDTVFDVVFSLILQVGINVGIPLLFYKFAYKMKVKEMLKFSSMRKTKWYNYLIAIAIGITAMFVTIGISTFWQVIISLFGYTSGSTPTIFPNHFNFGLFLLSIFLTAILPGFCEEIAMRGGYLTTMKKSFKYITLLVIMGISFGLFHQNIRQVFYTAFFGALMAAVTIKTKSIFPAMIIHFFNNGTSVYLDYAENYGWWGGSFFDTLQTAINNNFFVVLVIYVVICAVLAGLIALMWYMNSATKLKHKKEIILDSAYDVTNKRVVMLGTEDKEKVKEFGLEQEVYGEKLSENLYKPTLDDNIFYIGAIVLTALTTIFSFIYGFIV